MIDPSEYEDIRFDSLQFPVTVQWDKRFYAGQEKQFINERWHEQLEIKYFLCGGAVVECESKTYLAQDGDVFLINPCERHSTYYFSGQPRWHCVMVDARLMRSAQADALEMMYITPFVENRLKFLNLIRGDERIQPIVRDLIGELERRERGFELAFKGALFHLFAMLFRGGAVEAVARPRTDPAHKYHQRLEPAFSYIREHFAENIGVEELAGLCGMSKYHFCRIFKGVTGKTVVSYLNEYRLGKAEMLLTETRMRVEDIALSVGFQQASYFTRAFKAAKGITPASLRDKK